MMPMTSAEDGVLSPLRKRIEEFQEAFLPKAPKEIVEAMRRGTENLVRSGIAEQALKGSMKVPDFSLPSQNGEVVRLQDLLRRGPTVVTFYRGGW